MSQGTSSLMSLLSTRPDYNSKIMQAHFFSPVAFMKYLPNPHAKKIAIPFLDMCIQNKVKILNFTEILTAAVPLSKVVCDIRINPFWTEVCKSLLFILTGPNKYKFEIDTVKFFNFKN